MATLTKRQKQLIDYLNDYISEHGYAPTLAEVGFAVTVRHRCPEHLLDPKRLRHQHRGLVGEANALQIVLGIEIGGYRIGEPLE